MNTQKFFAQAAASQIQPFELTRSVSSSVSIHIYQDDVEDYKIANDSSITGRGIYKGKLGTFRSDRTDVKVIEPMMEAIKSAAEYGYDGNPDFFISKGRTYKRVRSFTKALEDVQPETLIELGKKISRDIRKAEKRIQVCEVFIEKKSSSSELSNSNSLSLKEKTNYISLYASVNIKDGDEVQSAGNIELITDFASFDEKKFTGQMLSDARSKLGAQPVKSGKYNVIFDKDVVPLLIEPLVSQLSAFDVHQHLSLFEGKIGTQVLSKDLTITQNPFAPVPFAASFDCEGIPAQKKELFTKGVLNTYLYDLETAKQDKTESTGNGTRERGNIRPAPMYIEVKPGRRTLEELAAKVKNGLYIIQLDGIDTGLNRQSGDYSLQAEGYVIKDGKIAEPVTLITVAGNLVTDFGRIAGIASDTKVSVYGIGTPSVAVRGIVVSGK